MRPRKDARALSYCFFERFLNDRSDTTPDITLEDETGLANLIIRPDLYERERQLLHEADLLLVTGLTQRAGQANSLLVQAVAALQP